MEIFPIKDRLLGFEGWQVAPPTGGFGLRESEVGLLDLNLETHV
jgi:hypothetical protein